MDSLMEIIKNNNINSYSNFVLEVNNNKTILDNLLNRISNISNFSLLNIYKVSELGTIRHLFYDISRNKQIHHSLLYSYGFNGYIDCLKNVQLLIHKKNINKCKFNKKNIVKIKDSYYVSHLKSNFVSNTINIKDKIIITGPNASGKTTVLKSTLLNIIYSQQIGYGFYKKASICPFHYIHCYINIPDTSGRDSLFQAEARRCLDIINVIKQNPKKRHFAIFDEIYSGTNPLEAAISASAFLEFLSKYNSFNCLLTTHYLDICKNLKNNNKIQNFKMECNYHNNNLIYKYKCIKGISNVNGGIDILEKMNYPSEILVNCKKYL
jgi:DNA mismatch repair ATPase MutS